MMTRIPFLPASVTVWPLGACVKVVPDCGRRSTVPGCPFWNSTVSRSYPGCVPVRRALMNATGWPGVPMTPEDAQMNWGRFASAVGDGLGIALGDGEATGVGLDPGTGTTGVGGRLSGLATTRTAITRAAMTAAAIAAIQKGPRCSGATASDDRTRSGSAADG